MIFRLMSITFTILELGPSAGLCPFVRMHGENVPKGIVTD
jgi:hypothetical protein